MTLHRLGSLMAAYTVIGLGLTATILVSQRYLPYAPEVTLSALSSPTPSPATLSNPQANLDVILDILHRDYLSNVNDRTLFASSFKLLKEYLAEQKVDVKEFPDLPEEVKDRKELTLAWKSMLETVGKTAGDEYPPSKLNYLALKGLILGLNDPYCSVLEPREFQVFEEHMNGGNFSGIGVMIELDRDNGNRVTVSRPIQGGPADGAGIKAGDVLKAIDGKSTEGWDIEKAANNIRGPEGSTVTLTVFRPKEDATLEIKVQREMIHVRSVESKLAAPKIGYLQLQMFGEETGKEFMEEIHKVRSQGAEALIIDLRNNGGGYVNAALDICSHFVPRGKRVVSVVNPRRNEQTDHNSKGKEPIHWPCVVLVNRFSASASEITAGCLQDHKRAKLIGETTFGKASVQQIERFLDGGGFKYTIAHYLTPSGKDIHRKGIKADIPIETGENDQEDKVLEVAIKTLQGELKK